MTIIKEVKCECFFCSGEKQHPQSHEKFFESMSTLPSDELEPGPMREFCTLCGHERLMARRGPISKGVDNA